MSNIEQIIATARKQHERSELTLHELKEVYTRWGVNLIVDGDSIIKNVINKRVS